MSSVDLIWETRKDGMYLSVEAPPGDSYTIDELKRKFIKDGIMNVDLKRIDEIVQKATGRFEYVGDHFVRFDEEKRKFFQVNVHQHVATLFLEPSLLESDLRITSKDVEFILSSFNVIVGIEWAEISNVLNKNIVNSKVAIARCIEPIHGENGKILEMVKVDPNAKPLHLNNGKVDFRQLDNIQQIDKEDLIARRVPPTQGTPGTDIFGNSLPPIAGEDVLLPRGSYTYITSDSLELRASNAGYLYREERNIAVGRLFIVPGDVDFKSGNIKYSGDVLVQGNVLSNFKVEANGTITINGTIEAAEITSFDEDVIIKGGVFGKEKAVIKAAKNIQVAMAQDCELRAEECVIFEKQLTNCQIYANSALSKEGRRSLINSCTFELYNELRAFQIGTNQGSPTSVQFLNRELQLSMEKFEELNKIMVKLQDDIEGYERRLRTMKNILKKAEEVTTRSKDELKKVLLQYDSAKAKLGLVDKKRTALSIKQSQRDILPGVIEFVELKPKLVIEMHGEEMTLKNDEKNGRVDWKNGGIFLGPISEKE